MVPGPKSTSKKVVIFKINSFEILLSLFFIINLQIELIENAITEFYYNRTGSLTIRKLIIKWTNVYLFRTFR